VGRRRQPPSGDARAECRQTASGNPQGSVRTGARPMTPSSKKAHDTVDAYIARAPATARAKLEELRAAIRSVAPDAIELVAYKMPGLAYPGYPGMGVFAWFPLYTSHITLFLRPPTVADHQKELGKYQTTKSGVRLPLDQKIPTPLVRKLVRASIRIMKAA
jgi:uncharacterized protein YdhG (YjbR/CyaY superfamily)